MDISHDWLSHILIPFKSCPPLGIAAQFNQAGHMEETLSRQIIKASGEFRPMKDKSARDAAIGQDREGNMIMCVYGCYIPSRKTASLEGLLE